MHEACENGDYPYAVRTAQESVELSLKSLLIFAGIDPPKWHDVGAILFEQAARSIGGARGEMLGFEAKRRCRILGIARRYLRVDIIGFYLS